MDKQDRPAPTDEQMQMQRLADALADMRDALVEVSLLLKDMSVEFDAVERKALEEKFLELLEKIKR